MNQKILLRGISRTPSDMASQDGFCAESLNVICDGGEVAPVIEPRDITDSLLLNDFNGKIIYIHKTSDYEKFICIKDNIIGAQGELLSDYYTVYENVNAIIEQKSQYGYLLRPQVGAYDIRFNEDDLVSVQGYAYYFRITGKASHGISNYNCVQSNFKVNEMTGFVPFLELGEEQFKFITSVGNTLIINTDKHVHYIIYKDKYKYIGTKIPEPQVRFESYLYDGSNFFTTDESVKPRTGASYSTEPEAEDKTTSIAKLNPTVWNSALTGDFITISSTTAAQEKAEFLKIQEGIWDSINTAININVNRKYFTAPVMLRYAVRLYDGRLIYASSPVYLGASQDEFFKLSANRLLNTVKNQKVASFNANFDNLYKSKGFLDEYDAEDWKDIIESIDFFVTPQLYNPVFNSRFVNAKITNDSSGDWMITSMKFDKQTDDSSEDMHKVIDNVSNFYLFKSIKFEDIKTSKEFDIEPVQQDRLLVKESLKSDYLSDYTPSALMGMKSYNNRVLLHGARYNIPDTYKFLSATACLQNPDEDERALQSDEEFQFRFTIRNSSGSSFSHVVRQRGYYTYDFGTYTAKSRAYGLITYPDPRCYKVEIYIPSENKVLTHSMDVHPMLNCAYAYCGVSNYLFDCDKFTETPVDEWFEFKDDEYYIDRNVVIQSESSNPFLFPSRGTVHFTGEVIKTETVTKALSTGQFGKYPIYVFTKDGIWALSISTVGDVEHSSFTEDGDIISSTPVSRDVALSADSITGIDQAIIFVTDKGVMLLEGSDIRNISTGMNGMHYSIKPSSDISSILSQYGWDDFKLTLEDDSSFMEYIKDAKCSYDYIGSRLIFFNPDKQDYQYVYKIDTDTWHKMSMPSLKLNNPLNSYPRAYIACTKDDNTRLMDFSSPTDANQTELEPLRGIIITRPLQFDQLGIYKTIDSVIPRGYFEKGSVKWLLLASKDGINYRVMHSLRGSSWRYYRLMIFSELKSFERLSYIDMEVNARFVNKTR